MSGPHQPGWSDEELISLHDLHVSRKSLDVPSTSEQSRNPKNPAQRPVKTGHGPVRTTQPQGAPRKARSSADQAQVQPRPQRQSQQQPQVRNAGVPQAQKRSTPPQPQVAQQRSTHREANVPSRAAHTATSHHPVTRDVRTATGRQPIVRTAEHPEPEGARHELNLRKLVSAIPMMDRSAINEKLREQVRFTLHDATVGVFSRKGGVGKTTITAYLGLTLAAMRNRPIVAIDGDSEAGSLGWLLAPHADSMLEELATARPVPTNRKEFAPYVTHTENGVDVVLGDTGECAPINEAGLQQVVKNLSQSYDMSLFDTGSGVTHSAGRVLINGSRVLLLVMGTSVDSVRAAERTLAWLDEREDAGKSPTAVIAVINGIPSQMRLSQIQQIEQLFTDRCAAVVRIPFDDYLAGGATSASLGALSKPTNLAFQQLAATTVQVLARSMPLHMNRDGRHA